MDAIYTRGWVIVDDFLNRCRGGCPRPACRTRRLAGIGRDTAPGHPHIRRDRDPLADPSSARRWLTIWRAWSPLRLAANRSLMLGLLTTRPLISPATDAATSTPPIAMPSLGKLQPPPHLGVYPTTAGSQRRGNIAGLATTTNAVPDGRLQRWAPVLFLVGGVPHEGAARKRGALAASPAGFGSTAMVAGGSIRRAERISPSFTGGHFTGLDGEGGPIG